MSTTKTPKRLRLGLLVVSVVLAFKRFLLGVGELVLLLGAPLGRFILKYALVPAYGVLYKVRRQLAVWYRPAKNRFMYFLCNRFSAQAVTIAIVLFAILVDTQFASARSSSLEFGQQSLLYGYVTGKSVQLVEETAGPAGSAVATTDYLNDGALAVNDGVAWVAPVTVPDDSALSVDSGIVSSAPISGTAIVSAAPRSETITYTVGNGDTLSSIAQAHGISLNTLLWANGLTAKSTIKPGQSLRILRASGVEHVVARGETLGGIAKKYGIAIDDIRQANALSDSSTVTVGLALLIPGGQKIAPIPTTVAKAKSLTVKEIFTAPPGTNKNVKPSAGMLMSWPADLHYIVRGLKWGHTGVDIDCDGHADGTSKNDNYAAADGVVQFSGWKRGYGNVVEIDHGNGLVTRYGHHHALYVKKGQVITAGTPLGRCGSTGNSTGTHLHFEVIVNGKFMNPLDYVR